jgi:EAL domain-containing protein (putative c-di-GMP-specific phosphodiesterase class I)
MPDIDRWMLQHVMKQMSAVVESGRVPEFRVGVNLSGDTLDRPEAIAAILDDITLAGFDPTRLVVEITETELIHNLDAAVDTMRRFRDAGVRVALDDFGVGYSSISHLRRIPADYLKLDHTFVAGILDDEQVAIIFESIVTMAHRLGLTVIAEGIETPGQLKAAAEMGVENVQGFLWGPPAVPEALPFWPQG